MPNLDSAYWANLERVEKQVELLKTLLKEKDLPDSLNDPQHRKDSINVAHFASKLYDISCELSALSEEMMVGDEVEKRWDAKPENCYESIEEKRQDHGVYARNH